MSALRSVAVFCGSTPGTDPAYVETARRAGATLAGRGIDVVYGGGGAGMMGALADGALAAGGRVTGVIPRSLVDRELAHRGVDDLVVVESMHERKQRMSERADAFVAMPGGAGTLEEITEQWTWAQLGLHDKPCGLLDVGGFWRPFVDLLERMTADGFVRASQAGIVAVESDLEVLLERLADPPCWTDKWGALRPGR
ncbi:TIGR00730 family Rossman fold protein [Aeromicrobium halocynthiae]|uniref:Cytokinin riboside 5'-monophosphate phosphoribohydrolase n=1 Tax=Aeromicrobium halocynthiae TaxID=560557 RepID=A0ABN2VRQ9_9ACTN